MDSYILRLNILLITFVSFLLLIHQQYNIYFILSLLFALLLILYYRTKNLTLLILVMLFSLIGVTRGLTTDFAMKSEFIENEVVEITGVVVAVPKVTEKDNGDISIKYVIDFSNKDHTKKKILAYVKYKKNTVRTEAKVNDIVKLRGQFTAQQNYNNPGAFNYKIKLLNEGIVGNVFVKNNDFSITREVRSGFKYYIYKIKDKILENLKNVMSPNDAAILFDMVFGGYDGINPEVLKAFSSTGIVHLLSVSGSHIALIVAFITWSGKLLKLSNKINAVLGIVIIIMYAALAGFVPPVIRSVLMGGLSLIAVILEKEVFAKNSLSIIALGMLFVNPLLLYDISFQLSFMATAGLLYLAPIISAKLYLLPQSIRQNLAITIAAQLATLPFLAWYFNTVSLSSIFSNLLAVPILEFMIILTILGVLLSLMVPLVAKVLLVSCSLLLGAVYDFIVLLSKFSYGSVYLPSGNIYYGIGYYIMLVGVFNDAYYSAIKKYDKKLWLINFVVVAMILTVIAYQNKYSLKMEVHFIDVGQGDCCLVITPHRKAILIDTGGNINDNFNIGEKVVVPYLRHIGITSLEYIILTHCHIDHAGGAGAVVDNINTKYVLIGKENRDLYAKAMKRSVEKCDNLIPVLELEQFKIDDVMFEIIPSENIISNNINEYSNVVKVSYGKNDFMITGDLEVEGENAILNKNINIASEVLKVGHHGSNTSSSEKFLKQVQPLYGVISVGYNNRFGHPDSAVLERMEKLGIKIYRTDLNGAIVFQATKDNLKVQAFR